MRESNELLHRLPAAAVMTVLCLDLTCLCGCATNPTRRTIGDEIVQKFGSIREALEQPWEARSSSPAAPRILLSLSQKADLMYAVKDCYLWESPKGDSVGPVGCCSPDLYCLCVGPVPNERFSFYFVKDGFLVAYLCPSPDDVIAVHRSLKALFSDDADKGVDSVPEVGNGVTGNSNPEEEDLF